MSTIHTQCPAGPRRSHGFSLAEVMLALGIIAFCLVAIFAFLPLGLTTNQNAVQQTEAANLISVLATDLKAMPKSAAAVSPMYGIKLSGSAELFVNEDGCDRDSSGVKLTGANAKYRVMLTCGTASGRNAIPLNILVTWPALADPLKASGRLESTNILDRN